MVEGQGQEQVGDPWRGLAQRASLTRLFAELLVEVTDAVPVRDARQVHGRVLGVQGRDVGRRVARVGVPHRVRSRVSEAGERRVARGELLSLFPDRSRIVEVLGRDEPIAASVVDDGGSVDPRHRGTLADPTSQLAGHRLRGLPQRGLAMPRLHGRIPPCDAGEPCDPDHAAAPRFFAR
ncbi:hypothetical protein [Actinomadura sp. KC06]|uniref:hypothetical protein n=1 Tax=Actinomadura sp. KC06 TaxID=2530369 RepID=UPI001FB5D685|nr:hypothetical protein [Actinomadura sp. KC06]